MNNPTRKTFEYFFSLKPFLFFGENLVGDDSVDDIRVCGCDGDRIRGSVWRVTHGLGGHMWARGQVLQN